MKTDTNFNNIYDGCSQGGYLCFYLVFLFPISWKSNKLRRVARSTLTAEPLAFTDGTNSAYFIHQLATNVGSLSLFCRYYFGRCSSELPELVPLCYCRGRSTRYSDRLHDFSVTIPRGYKDVYVNSFFPRIAILWNSLAIECFLMTYDLSDFKSRINRHLLTVGSF